MRRTGGTRHRARRTAAQWRELVERFERAGQSRGEFCAAHRWALSPFDLWRRKLRATPAAVEEARPEALFVELTNPAHTRTSPNPSLNLGSVGEHVADPTASNPRTGSRRGNVTERAHYRIGPLHETTIHSRATGRARSVRRPRTERSEALHHQR